MLQRIQSVYLLAVLILSCVMLFLPWASYTGNYVSYEFGCMGLCIYKDTLVTVLNSWALTAVAAIVPILALISIFLYKKRILQIRFCIFNLLLMASFYALFAVYFYIISQQGMKLNQLFISLVFPLINMIFTYLAIRAIKKDEELLRSMSRLR